MNLHYAYKDLKITIWLHLNYRENKLCHIEEVEFDDYICLIDVNSEWKPCLQTQWSIATPSFDGDNQEQIEQFYSLKNKYWFIKMYLEQETRLETNIKFLIWLGMTVILELTQLKLGWPCQLELSFAIPSCFN